MNDQNLNPLGSGKLTPEEEFKIRSAGGKASQAALREKRYSQKVKEEFQKLLELPYKAGDIEDIKSLQDINKNTSIALKLYMKLIRDYFETGNPRLIELIMRYSGGDEEIFEPDEPLNAQENSFIDALNKQATEVWKDEPKE